MRPSCTRAERHPGGHPAGNRNASCRVQNPTRQAMPGDKVVEVDRKSTLSQFECPNHPRWAGKDAAVRTSKLGENRLNPGRNTVLALLIAPDWLVPRNPGSNLAPAAQVSQRYGDSQNTSTFKIGVPPPSLENDMLLASDGKRLLPKSPSPRPAGLRCPRGLALRSWRPKPATGTAGASRVAVRRNRGHSVAVPPGANLNKRARQVPWGDVACARECGRLRVQ